MVFETTNLIVESLKIFVGFIMVAMAMVDAYVGLVDGVSEVLRELVNIVVPVDLNFPIV